MIDEANALCERLEQLVAEARAIVGAPGALAMVHDLRHTRDEITFLEQHGTPVPDHLREKAERLSASLREQERAHRALSILRGRLPATLRSISPGANTTAASRRRTPPPDKTGTLFS